MQKKKVESVQQQVLEKQREAGDGIGEALLNAVTPRSDPGISREAIDVPTDIAGLVKTLSGPMSETDAQVPIAGMSWAGGNHVGVGMTQEHARIATVSGPGIGQRTASPPSTGHDSGPPRCTESRSGKHMNSKDIFGS